MILADGQYQLCFIMKVIWYMRKEIKSACRLYENRYFLVKAQIFIFSLARFDMVTYVDYCQLNSTTVLDFCNRHLRH